MALRHGLEQMRRRATPGLVSDPQSGRRVSAARYAPPEHLVGVVDRLWTGEWDLRGQTPHDVRLLADPTVHLVFEAGRSRVVGVCRGLWHRRLEEQGRVRGVALPPGAVGALGLGDAQRWTDRLVPLAEAWPELAALERMVVAPAEDGEGLEQLLRWLSDRFEVAQASEVVTLLRDMRQDRSLQRVDAVAAHAGLSVRSLQRRFREEVGVSPKWVLQRYRLQAAVQRIEDSQDPLSDVAYELGFADQAHLTRSFRSAVGVSPAMFRRERGPEGS